MVRARPTAIRRHKVPRQTNLLRMVCDHCGSANHITGYVLDPRTAKNCKFLTWSKSIAESGKRPSHTFSSCTQVGHSARRCTPATGCAHCCPNTHRTGGGNCSKCCTLSLSAAKPVIGRNVALCMSMIAMNVEQTPLMPERGCDDADASCSSQKGQGWARTKWASVSWRITIGGTNSGDSARPDARISPAFSAAKETAA